MANILLISEETLKNDSLIGDNVESQFILPAINVAQEQHLQQLIGTKLLRKIQALIEDNTITGSTYSDYKYLLDEYITIYLEYKVLSEIQIPLSFKMRNSGLIQNADTQQKQLDNKDIMFIKQFYDDKATYFAGRISDYLCANSTKYSEYKSTDSKADIHSKQEKYSTGIYLGSKKKLNR
jgi:hypothetical protein